MKPFYHTLFFLLGLLILSFSGKAQFINFGQSRSSLRWKQISTQNFQIIYPDFFESNAQKVANYYTQLYQHANTLQIKPKKISVILQADGGVSNGNVTSVPRKTELYTMPSPSPSDDWLTHLCIHEFRHVVQLDKVNQGTTKDFSYLFGELFPIAIVGIYVPMWFMEGDAVCFETAIGRLGRGRSPEFLNQMKAQIIEKGIYPFSKAVLGSNKDFVPNRYIMGYFMTANTRVHYGANIWSKALEYSGSHPFRFNSFQKSLAMSLQEKRDSIWGSPSFRSLFTHPDSLQKANQVANAKEILYRDNFSELQQLWTKEANQIANSFDTLYTNNKNYTNYYYPTPIKKNTIIAYKKGLDESGSFVLLSKQQEKRITRTGTLEDFQFAYQHNRLVWSEYIPHFRWEQGGRMRLCSYDLTNKKYKRYRGKNNQFTPFVTDQGWGYVEIDPQNRSFLVLCDSTLQNEICRFAGKEGELFIHPSYAQGKILTVIQSTKGIRLEEIDIHTGIRTQLTKDQLYEIDHPIATDSAIVFRASYNGNNAFYQLQNGKITSLLTGKYGVRFPHYDSKEKQLYFSFYTSDGYKPAKATYPSISSENVEYHSFRLAEHMKKEENWQLPFSSDSIYSSRKYSSCSNLFNVHSWGPLAIDFNEMQIDLGAMIYSQNQLNTLSFYAGYVLKSGYEHGCWLLNATYSKWWPILSLQLESGKSHNYNIIQTAPIGKDSLFSLYIYNKVQHTKGYATILFPFNFSSKQYIRHFQPYLRYKIEALHHQKVQETSFLLEKGNTNIAYPINKQLFNIHQSSQFYQLLEYGLKISNQTRMTPREITPRWGQSLSIGYNQILHQTFNLDDQWWYDIRLYFPGFIQNHSIDIYHGFQQMLSKIKNYSNLILYPRGITLPGYEIASIRCSYHFPISYPDLSIGSFLYLKNLSGSLFYDFGNSRNKIGHTHYSSYGIEIKTDSHLFQLTFPIHWGIRTGYETQSQKMFAEFLFSIGLSI